MKKSIAVIGLTALVNTTEAQTHIGMRAGMSNNLLIQYTSQDRGYYKIPNMSVDKEMFLRREHKRWAIETRLTFNTYSRYHTEQWYFFDVSSNMPSQYAVTTRQRNISSNISLQYLLFKNKNVKCYAGIFAGTTTNVNTTTRIALDMPGYQTKGTNVSYTTLNCGIEQYLSVQLSKRINLNSLIQFSTEPLLDNLSLIAPPTNARISWRPGVAYTFN